MFLIAVAMLLVGFVLLVSRQRRGDRGFSPIVIAPWAVGSLALAFLALGVGGGGESQPDATVFFTAPLDGSPPADAAGSTSSGWSPTMALTLPLNPKVMD